MQTAPLSVRDEAKHHIGCAETVQLGRSPDLGKVARWNNGAGSRSEAIGLQRAEEAVQRGHPGREDSVDRSVWRSLRTRIFFLAIVTCVFLAVAVSSLSNFIRSTHRTTVSEAGRHLSLVVSDLARAYSSQAATGYSLRNTAAPARPHGPPPPPPGAGRKAPKPPPPPVDPLSPLTAGVLQEQEGIEGGFLAGDGPLIGYAFPTHEGPGNQKEMPQRERPTIDDLAHKAEQTGSAQSFAFEGPHDVVIFTAEPVREVVDGVQQITGAAWLMQRLPEINRGRSKQLLFVSLGFGAAALMTAFLAWFVTIEVSGGVTTVTDRLASLEGDLARPAGEVNRPQLAEFERILAGINAMATSLQNRISTQRNLEEQLRHRERLSSLGQFAAGVAHELRNPLATIRLRAQMTQHAPTEETIARNSGVILEEVDRLDAMIGRLLYFARPISLDLQRLNVEELCATVIHSWQGRSPASIQLWCETADHIEIMADRSRLLQVLNNLVENAIQATRGAPGEVILRTTQQQNEVRIDVLDQGPGFSPEALKHAFDPFYTTKETGTGLGLSIAFELVEAHGGTLTAESRPEGGAIVSIALPQRGLTGERAL